MIGVHVQRMYKDPRFSAFSDFLEYRFFNKLGRSNQGTSADLARLLLHFRFHF